jgi:hypothetical protein
VDRVPLPSEEQLTSPLRGLNPFEFGNADFQAPGFYEKQGFKRIAELKDWPLAILTSSYVAAEG